MFGKRAGMVVVFGLALLFVAVDPVAAQGGGSISNDLIWGLNNQLLYVAVPITVLVEGILIYTVWRFSRSESSRPTQENRRLEVTWTLATAVILLFVGIATYQVLGNPYVTASGGQVDLPDDGEEISVTAVQFAFQFEYHNVSVDDVNGSELTLENVDVAEGTVTETTDQNVTVESATVSGEEIESGTLDVGTVENVSADQGETVSFENVTVTNATISETSVSGATLSSIGTVHMPVDRNVELLLSSEDVIHSFHVPELGLKADAFPGHTNRFRTQPTEPGEYQLYCAEYCGVGHSDMLGTVVVHEDGEYDEWAEEQWLEDQ